MVRILFVFILFRVRTLQDSIPPSFLFRLCKKKGGGKSGAKKRLIFRQHVFFSLGRFAETKNFFEAETWGRANLIGASANYFLAHRFNFLLLLPLPPRLGSRALTYLLIAVLFPWNVHILPRIHLLHK